MRVAALTVCVCILLATAPAHAHPARASALLLDFADTAVTAEIQIPLDQLGLVFDRPYATPEGTATLLSAHGPELSTYVVEHAQAEAGDGRPFAVKLLGLRVEKVDDADALVAQLLLTPPVDASPRQFTLHYDGLLHKVVTHKIYVSARGDTDIESPKATSVAKPELLTVLHYQSESVVIDRGPSTRARGSAWSRLAGFVTGGGWAVLLLMAGAAVVTHRGRRRDPAAATNA